MPLMDDGEFQVEVTIPVAENLIEAVHSGDRGRIRELLVDVVYPVALVAILAGAVDPLLLLDADFDDVQFDHPALCYHAGRYENGDRDVLAVHCYVHRLSIPADRLAIHPTSWKTGSPRWKRERA